MYRMKVPTFIAIQEKDISLLQLSKTFIRRYTLLLLALKNKN
jgi:hypothetical protein